MYISCVWLEFYCIAVNMTLQLVTFIYNFLYAKCYVIHILQDRIKSNHMWHRRYQEKQRMTLSQMYEVYVTQASSGKKQRMTLSLMYEVYVTQASSGKKQRMTLSLMYEVYVTLASSGKKQRMTLSLMYEVYVTQASSGKKQRMTLRWKSLWCRSQ